MGTHPIFESDFDCLTAFRNRDHVERRGSLALTEQQLVPLGRCSIVAI